MSVEIVTILVGGAVTIATALFGYLKLRDQRKFTSIEEQIRERQVEHEADHKSHLACLERAARLEERLKIMEEALGRMK